MKSSLKKASKLIKSYHWNSIFFRYWKKILLIILLPLLVVNTALVIYYNNLSVNETIRSIKYDYLQISTSISNYFTKIQESSTLLSSNSKIRKFLTFPDMSKADIQLASSYNDAIEIMRTVKISIEYIDVIRVYSFLNNYVISTSEGNYIEKYYDTSWYKYYKEHPNTDFVINNSDTKSGNLIICYTIRSGNTSLGLMIFELNTQHIHNILRNDEYSYYNIQILDLFNNPLFTTDTKNQIAIPEKNMQDLQSNNGIRFTKYYDTVFLSSNVGTINTLVMTAKLNMIRNNKGKIIIICILCFLIVILSALALSFYISMQFYDSIQDIIINFHKFENRYKHDNGNPDELSFITNSIIQMRDDKVSLEKELTKKIAELKKLQSAALQMQFSPHFLFNTLNVISMIIISITNGNNPASRTLCLLSELLTIALDTNEYIVTIDQEILYCNKYVEIENIKNKNNFDTIYDVDEEILHLKTPKLILQPIIENAFKHGIKYLRNESRGLLIISAHKKDSDIIFSVSDNGPGIDSKKLIQLQEVLNTNDMPDPRHIGLCNVNSRIKLIFGDQYGLSITSEKNNTRIMIRIPVTE